MKKKNFFQLKILLFKKMCLYCNCLHGLQSGFDTPENHKN